MRVLLIEDDPMIGASVSKGLRLEGMAVDWMRDGRAGELALADTAYDVVLLDLGLPGISGLEVIRRLRHWTTVPTGPTAAALRSVPPGSSICSAG